MRVSQFRLTVCFAFCCALLFLLVVSPTAAHAQTADRLSQVRKIYVDSLGADHGAGQIREQLIRRLRKSHDIQLVSSAKEADAVLRGSGRIWVTGHISANGRTHSPSQPTFSGVLSAELVGKQDETLWSYLVSPSNFVWNGVADDLASHLANKLLASLMAGDRQGPDVTNPAAQFKVSLQGAGGTFPGPLYQRWLETISSSVTWDLAFARYGRIPDLPSSRY
jgi:hypothetical protein